MTALTKNTEQVGLRLPEDLNHNLAEMAQQKGISKNAFILILIDLGLSKYISTPNNQDQQ